MCSCASPTCAPMRSLHSHSAQQALRHVRVRFRRPAVVWRVTTSVWDHHQHRCCSYVLLELLTAHFPSHHHLPTHTCSLHACCDVSLCLHPATCHSTPESFGPSACITCLHNLVFCFLFSHICFCDMQAMTMKSPMTAKTSFSTSRAS